MIITAEFFSRLLSLEESGHGLNDEQLLDSWRISIRFRFGQEHWVAVFFLRVVDFVC